MLPRRVLDVLGAGLVALGVIKYWFSTFQDLDAIVIGLALGAATIAAGRMGGGPKPVPRGGYTFEGAMDVMRRATWGGMAIAGILTGLVFYLWIVNRAGPLDVLTYFALGLLVAFASLIASAGLVVVDAVVNDEEEDGDERAAPAGSPVSSSPVEEPDAE